MSSEWSVVLYSLPEDIAEFRARVYAIFGKEGLDWYGLGMIEGELNTELWRGLSVDDAQRIVQDLNSIGGVVKAELTSDLTDLLNTAEEIWADIPESEFSEVDGMVFLERSASARKHIDQIRERTPNEASWRIESFINHEHVDHIVVAGSDEECIEYGEKRAAEYTAGLQTAYPERSFTIWHVPCDVVSFWQTTIDSPKGDCIPVKDDRAGKAWCDTCKGFEEYEIIDHKNRYFPNATWGKCIVCGRLVLVHACEKMVHIGPGTSDHIEVN